MTARLLIFFNFTYILPLARANPAIGKTGRNMNTRLTEHKQETCSGDTNNHVNEHHLLTNQ